MMFQSEGAEEEIVRHLGAGAVGSDAPRVMSSAELTNEISSIGCSPKNL
jgi:hypothetical protein